MSNRDHRAFSLIELIVVISLVTLLIALLMPALSLSRNTASMTQSYANLRSLHTFITSYANDFKANSPYVTFPPTANAAPYNYKGKYTQPFPNYNFNWASVLWDMYYIEDHRVFWSPARDLNVVANLGFEPLYQRFNSADPLLVASMLSRIQAPSPSSAYTGQAGVYWSMVGYGMVPINGVNPQTCYANVRNVDQALRVSLERTIAMAESWNSLLQYVAPPAAGSYYVRPGAPADPSFGGFRELHSRLYNYNGRVARSYWDGHVTGTAAEAIGWDVSAEDNTFVGGPYGGAWMYESFTDWRSKAPWYTDWETSGVLD